MTGSFAVEGLRPSEIYFDHKKPYLNYVNSIVTLVTRNSVPAVAGRFPRLWSSDSQTRVFPPTRPNHRRSTHHLTFLLLFCANLHIRPEATDVVR